MNAKEMAQAQDTVRTNAIKRRMTKKPPPVDQKNQNKDLVDERKDAEY